MLYFTETGWTLPDMKEVSAEFDRDYDQDEYEAKIAGLIQSYLRRTQTENEEEWDDWTKAAEKLAEEDHYLTVMIDAVPASGGRLRRWLPAFVDNALQREHGDRLRLWLTALICVFGVYALSALLTWIFGPGWTDYVFRSR
jgi:predicted dithiol-disulfide oxidoreductase (DUF899 family)